MINLKQYVTEKGKKLKESFYEDVRQLKQGLYEGFLPELIIVTAMVVGLEMMGYQRYNDHNKVEDKKNISIQQSAQKNLDNLLLPYYQPVNATKVLGYDEQNKTSYKCFKERK